MQVRLLVDSFLSAYYGEILLSSLYRPFYAGHGMSIGSGTDGGADLLLVDDLTIHGADNGLRIKSDPISGGYVHDVTYRNVCIRNVRNPLVFTPHYTAFAGNKPPIYRDITLDLSGHFKSGHMRSLENRP